MMSEWLLKELEFDGTLVSIGGLGVSEVWLVNSAFDASKRD